MSDAKEKKESAKPVLEAPLGKLGWRLRRRLRRRLKESRRILEANRDLLRAEQISSYTESLNEFQSALQENSREKATNSLEQMAKQEAKIFPRPRFTRWQEMVDVILVAAVVAFGGIRTFWVMPFKIPTASMSPTMQGIEPMALTEPMPSLPIRLVRQTIYGARDIEIIATNAGDLDPYSVRVIKERKISISRAGGLRIFDDESVGFEVESIRYKAPMSMREFQKIASSIPQHVNAGEKILRATVTAGDHLLVERVSYNFHRPKRGEVVVFDTQKMAVSNPGNFYIKRLNGIGGDELRIDPPYLFVNSHKANSSRAYERIYSRENGYSGYTFGPPNGVLTEDQPTYRVPTNTYFMMGDNSANSADSRYWGAVAHNKIVGKALFVYWPYSKRFGKPD